MPCSCTALTREKCGSARISREELLTYLLNFVIDFAGHPPEFIEKLRKEQLCDLYA